MPVPAMAFPGRAILVPRERSRFGLGGRSWTERCEGSFGVSSWRSPTPATPKHSPDTAPPQDLAHVSTRALVLSFNGEPQEAAGKGSGQDRVNDVCAAFNFFRYPLSCDRVAAFEVRGTKP